MLIINSGFIIYFQVVVHISFVRQIFCMENDLIQPERIKAIQESICGFLLDEVINPTGEFYANPRISVGRADPNTDISDDDEAPKDT